MQTQFFAATDRGVKDQGWLKSHFHFSFSDYGNPSKSAFGTLITFNDDYLQPEKRLWHSSARKYGNYFCVAERKNEP